MKSLGFSVVLLSVCLAFSCSAPEQTKPTETVVPSSPTPRPAPQPQPKTETQALTEPVVEEPAQTTAAPTATAAADNACADQCWDEFGACTEPCSPSHGSGDARPTNKIDDARPRKEINREQGCVNRCETGRKRCQASCNTTGKPTQFAPRSDVPSSAD